MTPRPRRYQACIEIVLLHDPDRTSG